MNSAVSPLQINAILSRAVIEWNSAERKISGLRDGWIEQYKTNFKNKESLWTDRYLAFNEKKDGWVKEMVKQAVDIGNSQILGEIPTMTEDSIADVNTFIISDVIEKPDTERLMKNIMNEDMLSGLLSGSDCVFRRKRSRADTSEINGLK